MYDKHAHVLAMYMLCTCVNVMHIYTCVYVHEVIGDVEGKRERKKERKKERKTPEAMEK